MDNSQAIFLARKFLNLDISFCDPVVWYSYMIDQCSRKGSLRYGMKYIDALNALVFLQQHPDEIDKFYDFIQKSQLMNEVHELLHAIPENPTPLQHEVFHWIESKM